MTRPANIRYYLAGTNTLVGTGHSADGVNFTTNIDLADGTYSLEATAQRVAETESARSAPHTVVVGAATAPTITSPLDWDEVKTDPVTITVQSNAGETVRIFANGIQKGSDLTANGSGIATTSINLDSASLTGIETVEIITAHRVISGNLSHPAIIHVVPSSAKVIAKGVTTSRIIQTSSLLSLFRYTFGGSWDNEAIYAGMNYSHGLYRMNKGSGENTASIWYPALSPLSYTAGMAPGYFNSDRMRNHVDRLDNGVTGKVSFHGEVSGDPWDALSFAFDYALLTAAAYFRGDRTSYSAYKAKMLEILASVPVDSNGLVRQGVLGTGRLRAHGWPGTPVDRGSTWYAAHTGGLDDIPGVIDPVYWPETEPTARYVFATRLLKKMADLEGDTTTSTACDGYIATFKAGVSSQIRTDNLLEQTVYTGANNPGYAATAMAIVADSFSTSGQRSAALTALVAICSRFGGSVVGPSGSSPIEAGAAKYCGLNPIFPDSIFQVGYSYPHLAGQFCAAIAMSDASLARSIAEDNARFNIAWFQQSMFNWIGFNWGPHHGGGLRGSHWSAWFKNPLQGTSAWFQDADDKYGDLAPIVVNGTVNSTAILQVPFGHRITAIDIVASSSCTATIDVYANDDIRGIGSIGTACGAPYGTAGWPSPLLGADQLMATVSVNGTTASKTSGVKPFGAYSGGQIKVKVAAVTSEPATFTITLHQARIIPTFVADVTLGFTDNFVTDRMAEYTAIEGSKPTTPTNQRTDTGPAGVSLAPLTRSMFKSTSSTWTTLVQTASNFADGVIMIDKAMVVGSVVDYNGIPNQYAKFAVIFRYTAANGGSYIKLDSDMMLTQVVNGVAGSPVILDGVGSNNGPWSYGYTGYDQRYLLVVLRGTSIQATCWLGGTLLPFEDGLIGYGESPVMTGSVIIVGAGAAGFGTYGATEIDSVRICGEQTQPIPPGFILDTGMNIPKTEAIIPQCFITGENAAPASDTCCLRNEWGAQVSPTVTGYNARWSY